MSNQARNIYIPEAVFQAARAMAAHRKESLSLYISKLIIAHCKLPIVYEGKAGNGATRKANKARKDGGE